jgi:hypothetical protein
MSHLQANRTLQNANTRPGRTQKNYIGGRDTATTSRQNKETFSI